MRLHHVLISLALFIPTGVLMAGPSNYQNYIPGARASGMGGAVVATADALDAAFFNPAGLTRTKSSMISLSASLYGVQRHWVDDSFYPGEDLESSTFVTVPSAIGTVMRLGEKTAAAFSVFEPYKKSAHEIDSIPELQHFNTFSDDDQILWIGPSIGHQFSPRLSWGVAVYGVYRSLSRFVSMYWNQEALSYSFDVKANSLGLVVLVGLQYKPTDRWNIGLVLQPPSTRLTGSGTVQNQVVLGILQADNKAVEYADDLEVEYRLPARVTLGVGWVEPRRYGWGLDVTYHLAETYATSQGRTQSGQWLEEETRDQAVVDVNIGGEYFLAKKYPLRAGFFTSFSTEPKARENSDYPYAGLDLYGVTASIGSTGKAIDSNLGINYAWGHGNDYGTKQEDGHLVTRVVDSTESQLYLFINTSYNF